MYTSREIAEAIVARAFARYPQAVELPAEECPECLGQGSGEVVTGGWDIPRSKRVACTECKGKGTLPVLCDRLGHGLATTVLGPKGFEVYVCETCATVTRGLTGEELTLAFALRTLP